jgi:hypothetical protein
MTMEYARQLAHRLSVFVAIFGCSGAALAGQWADYAQRVADLRIAAAHGEQIGSPADQPLSPGIQSSDITTAREPAAPFNVRAGGEVGITLLAADEPASQPVTPAESQPVTIDRGPLPSFWDTVKRDVQEMPGQLWHDTKKVYLNPWNVLFLVGAGGTSLALRPGADDCIEDHYNPYPGRYKHTLPHGFRNFLDAAGNPGTAFAVAGAMYLTGQVFQDIKTYEVGKRMASALIITDMSTLFLKLCAADTKAPNKMFYAWPSGHMSSTMALATVLNDAYGPLAGIPAYTFTAFLGIERLDDREHKFSDVVFGAALGWVVAETVMKEHRPEIFGGEIVPYVDPETGNSGIAWLKTLGK